MTTAEPKPTHDHPTPRPGRRPGSDEDDDGERPDHPISEPTPPRPTHPIDPPERPRPDPRH